MREPVGACQACFRSQQTQPPVGFPVPLTNVLVLHGYRRPGTGYIVGNCYGMKYAPFEVSCERTKQFVKDILRPALANHEFALRRHHARPEKVSYTANVYLGNFKHASVVVDVLRDEPEGYKPTPYKEERDTTYAGALGHVKAGRAKMVHHPSYDQVLKQRIGEIERGIERIKHDITEYERRIAEWKPVPWPPAKVTA